MINIAVMGYGTVGSGVVEVIRTNGSLINERVQDEIYVNMYWISETFREILWKRF